LNILILGKGAREHAFAWKISRSKLLTNLFIAPGNAGTLQFGENIDISVNDFVNASVLEEQITQRHIVEFGTKSYFSKTTQLKDAEVTNINFNTAPQPAFNRNFNLLIDNLKNFELKKYSIFIFADNPKQLERLHTIFSDLTAEINFTPITASIHEGYIDNDLKVVCYTDHQIFQRYHKYKVKQAFSKNKALTLKTLRELQPGDYSAAIDTAQLSKLNMTASPLLSFTIKLSKEGDIADGLQFKLQNNK